MTVNTTTSIITYAGNGSTTLWSFPFPAIDPTFIQVFITDPTGNVTQQAANLYTVTLNSPIAPNPTAAGGTVLFPLIGSPLAVGNQITILRNLPATQTVSISNQSIVYPPVIEKEFDYLTLLGQQTLTGSTRAFSVGPSDPIPALVPPVALRKSQGAFFDLFGNLTAGAFTSPGVVVSAAMQPVVGASTLPLAQVAMGVAPINSPVFTGSPQAPTPLITDNSAELATTAFVQALQAAIFSTGDLKPTHKVVADPGWILLVDGAIGDAVSGAGIRSNADTQALFTLYYNNYSDAICPLATNSGVSTTRVAQGVALAAFNAHCRIGLPLMAGRALAIAGAGAGLTTRVVGSTTGTETTTPTTLTTAFHNHPFIGTSSGLATTTIAVYNPNANISFAGAQGVEAAAMQGIGAGNPFNVMQPSTFVNIMVKL
jgi:hypothetical protein